MNTVQRTALAVRQVRQMSGVVGKQLSAQKEFGPMSEKVKTLQQHFQDPQKAEIPVYLRGGSKDKILFGLTIALLLVCTGGNAAAVYKRLHPE